MRKLILAIAVAAVVGGCAQLPQINHYNGTRYSAEKGATCVSASVKYGSAEYYDCIAKDSEIKLAQAEANKPNPTATTPFWLQNALAPVDPLSPMASWGYGFSSYAQSGWVNSCWSRSGWHK